MKQLSQYRAFLWLRKMVVYGLIMAIVFGLMLYYVANSPFVIKKAVDTFAPDYNISYSRIYGNVFTGLEIEDLSYNKESLAKHITLKWNPNGIANKKILVNTLQIEKANIDTIKAFANSFVSADDNESNKSSTEASQKSAFLPKWVLINRAEISLDPFVYDTVKVNHFVFTGKDLVFDIEKPMFQNGNVDLNISTNLSDIFYHTKVKNNLFTGQIRLASTPELFKLLQLPLRKEAIGDIVIDINASEKHVAAGLSKTMKQVLESKEDGFNLDVDSLTSSVVYDIAKASLRVETHGILSTPYAKDIVVSNLFTMDDNISYSGEIYAKQIMGIDARFVKPLNHLQINYVGGTSSVHAKIKSDNLQGVFDSDDFKTAKLHLETPEAIALRDMVQLPAELNQSKATLQIDVPIDFETNATLVAEAKIQSNLISMDANISYKEYLEVKSVSTIPQESLLRPYSKELKWDRLNPILIEVKLTDKEADIVLGAASLFAEAHYVLKDTKVDGRIQLGGLEATIAGKVEEKITMNTNIHSTESLMKSIEDIYTLTELPVVKGGADVLLEITALKKVDLTVKSPEILYQPNRKTEHQMNDISVAMSMEDSKVQIPNYTFTYNKQTFFATKPSMVSFTEDSVRIAPLWINDELQVQGEYNLKTQKGTINALSNNLHIAHELAELDSGISIQTALDGNKTAINGKVTLLGGNILYDLGQKSYASDSDIVIVQEMKKQEKSAFMDNLSVAVQVKTDKPFVYHKDVINIQAMVDLTVHKAEQSNLMVLGSVEILEGGTYLFEGKKFVLDKSYVYFTGDANKPLVEARVKYKSLNHLITITISGSANTPNIDFASVPKLSKEEILSVILFDSEGGAGTNSSEDMMKMMGGAMAKSALSDLGVQLDHLVLGASGSVEVGKKLTDKITVIYINGQLPVVKVKYKHGEHTESVLGASEESQSYDIIYKKDF